MIADYELAAYAKLMRIDLKFYVRNATVQLCFMREILDKDGKIDETKIKKGKLYLSPEGDYVVLLGGIIKGSLKELEALEDVVKAMPKEQADFEKWAKNNESLIMTAIPGEHRPQPVYINYKSSSSVDEGNKDKFNLVANIVNINAAHWQYDVTPSKAQREQRAALTATTPEETSPPESTGPRSSLS
jgi:hypothetical protein